MHDADVKPVPVDVFEAIRQVGKAEGDKGRTRFARSLDQLDVSINGFDDRALFLRKIIGLTDHGTNPKVQSGKFHIVI